MVYTNYTKMRILHYHFQGLKPYTIAKVMYEDEGVAISRYGVYKFLKVYSETGSIERLRTDPVCKVTARVQELVEQQMQKDDETTAYQLHHMLVENGIKISIRTILRCRTALGWTYRGSAYCQLIREANKQKRLQWCELNKDDSFDDVVWSDESTIQLENHRRFCCRKLGQAPKPKPR